MQQYYCMTKNKDHARTHPNSDCMVVERIFHDTILVSLSRSIRLPITITAATTEQLLSLSEHVSKNHNNAPDIKALAITDSLRT